MKRLTILELEYLRAVMPDLSGGTHPAPSLMHWLREARRCAVVSEDRQGFFLTGEQIDYWQRQGAVRLDSGRRTAS